MILAVGARGGTSGQVNDAASPDLADGLRSR